MYNFIQFIHSWSRWAVVILAVFAIANAYIGWLNNKNFEKKDNILNASFVGFMHLQALTGLILYFVYSPLGFEAFSRTDVNVMKTPSVRYWAVEHITVMLLAVVFAQVGRSLSKKATESIIKHKKAAIFFSISFVLMMSRIPWGESARLFRGL